MTTAFTDSEGLRRGDRTLVIKPVLKSGAFARHGEAMLEEAVGLARAIDLAVVEAAVVNVANPMPATLLGKGQVEHFGAIIAAQKISLAVVDHALVPVQQRNLEKAWKCKVIDRTGLILEIFGERAHTSEGMLQVELAALEYQKSRLVRSWTHLERQRGGFGFLGGPGESQLEMDRRMINARILKIKADLKNVRRTRGLQREARQRAEHPVIALVGYTNAGKSSLFNRLTGAEALAQDMLFATLDPAMRGIKLPGGREAILSDTVGFISDLPTHLVEAFRATLEEVQLADVILHVRDISHPEARAQKEAVVRVLKDLDISADDDRLIEVLNKIDLLPEEEQKDLKEYSILVTKEVNERAAWTGGSPPPLGGGLGGGLSEKNPPSAKSKGLLKQAQDFASSPQGGKGPSPGGTAAISALTGQGIDDLLALLDDKLSAKGGIYEIELPLSDGAALAWLHAHGKIIKKTDTKIKSRIKIQMAAADYGRFRSRFGEH